MDKISNHSKDEEDEDASFSNIDIITPSSGYDETSIAIAIEPHLPSIDSQFCVVHPVNLPPRVATSRKFGHKVREFLFPDDPFVFFRDQAWHRKVVLGLEFVFPILQWLPDYNLALLRHDVIAGITIASLAIPQGISYAKLANLTPIHGLYTSFVPPLIYAVLGSSKHMGIGPVSIASLVLGSMLSDVVSPTDDEELYLHLALTSTFVAGLLQAGMGILRLGFVIDFLSMATLKGFMAGTGVVVILQQLKGMLGITHFTKKMQIVPVLRSVFCHTDEWAWKTIVMAVCFLVLLLIAKEISARKPKLFWVSAASPLVCVILSTLIVYLLRSKLSEVARVGKLPKGINPSSVKMLYFEGPYVSQVVKTGILVAILSLTEAIAVGRTFATMHNYTIDANKETLAIGLINTCGSLCSCFIATGSFSRSAINNSAGAKTITSNIIMAVVVLIVLLFLMPLFQYTPNFVLSAIIITAVVGLIDYRAAYRLWKLDKLDFLAWLCSFCGVVFISVQLGLGVAVAISLLKIILHATRPNTSLLGNIPGTEIYRCLSQYKDATRVPSFLILTIECPVFFSNSNYLQERISRWIREEETRIRDNGEADLKCIILDMTAVTAIDTSGLDAMSELKKSMDRRLLKLALVNPVGNVMEKLHHSKVLKQYECKGLYLTIGEAVLDISSSWKR